MRKWTWLLALLVALPGAALDKPKKDKKKKDEQKAAAVETAADLVQKAEQQAAAGDVDAAMETLREAARLPDAAGEPELRLGRLHESRFEQDSAIDAYRAAAEKLAGAAAKGEALGRMAVAQEVRGMTEAPATAAAAVAADPEGAWPSIAMARARAGAGQGDEAAALAQKALAAAGPGALAAAHAALGRAHEARGDLAAAEAAYRAGVAAEAEGRVAPNLGLARVLRKTERAAEAEALLQQVLELAPGAVEAYKEAARVKLALRRPHDALADAATAAALAEHDREAQELLIDVHVARSLADVAANQIAAATQDLERLRDQHPDSSRVRVGLAQAHIAARQADAALAELRKAVELDAALAEAHERTGYVLHLLKGDAAGAVAAYEKAVAAEPGRHDYRTSLGAALSDSKQYDRAVAELVKVTQSEGYARPEAFIYLGAAHLAAKRYKDAVAALTRGAELAPESAQAEAYLAWCYFGMKDAEGFKTHGRKARTLGHKEPTLLDYLKRIEGGEPIK